VGIGAEDLLGEIGHAVAVAVAERARDVNLLAPRFVGDAE